MSLCSRLCKANLKLSSVTIASAFASAAVFAFYAAVASLSAIFNACAAAISVTFVSVALVSLSDKFRRFTIRPKLAYG